MWRKRRLHAGFTIIETLVALTFVAVTLLLATRSFLTILQVTTEGGNVTVANALAARELEIFRTQVEGQPTRSAWREQFCRIATKGTTSFGAPYDAYSYRILINQDAVQARSGQEDLLLPCFNIEWTRPGCPPGETPAYTNNDQCAPIVTDKDEDRVRWVTVEVFSRGHATPAARVTSAIIRGAIHQQGRQ